MPIVQSGQTAIGIAKSLGMTPQQFLSINPSFKGTGGPRDYMGLSGDIRAGQEYFTSSNPSATNPALQSPAAQTYIKNQTTPSSTTPVNPPVDTTAPSAYDLAKSNYTKAYQDYIDTLNPSAAINNAQNTYNDYVANQSKSIAGLAGRDAGVPLSLVRGQQEKLLSQTQPEAQRLQNQIAIEQQNQQAKSAAGLANVSLKEKLLGLEQSPEQKAKAALDTEKEQSDIAKTKAETENIAKKFEEDKRQFGLNYALDQQKLALDRYKANLAASSQSSADQQKAELAGQSINLVNSLLGGNFKSITGNALFGQNPLRFFGANAKEINEFNTLKAQLALGARSLLKGSGAISDYESRILNQSTSILGRNLKDADFEQALKDIRGVLKTNSGQTTEVIVTDPKTGQSKEGSLSGTDIYDASSQGYIVKYK